MITKVIKDDVVQFTAENDFDRELLNWYREFPVLAVTKQVEILHTIEQGATRPHA